jgi:hypothetical protein
LFIHPRKVFIYKDKGKNKSQQVKEQSRQTTLEHSEEKHLELPNKYNGTKHRYMFYKIQKSKVKYNHEKRAGLRLFQQ